jgi:hypothetical protein
MRTLALSLLLLPIAACSNFSWKGHGGSLTEEQKELGIRDVAQLATAYENESFYRGLRRRNDARSNAFGRNLMKMQDFIDRHFWNCDPNDPSVHYPSETSMFEHVGEFLLVTGTSIPPMDGISTR